MFDVTVRYFNVAKIAQKGKTIGLFLIYCLERKSEENRCFNFINEKRYYKIKYLIKRLYLINYDFCKFYNLLN